MGLLSDTRVLVVDDDEAQRDVLQEVLTMESAEVLCAASADEAVALLARGPDVVLMDLHGVNVEAFVAAMRQRFDRCALILVSGDVRLKDHAARLGADGYLGKPYEIEALLRTCAAAKARRGAGEAASPP